MATAPPLSPWHRSCRVAGDAAWPRSGAYSAGMVGFLFERDGAVVIPSELTGGPWSDDAQHGGPVSALLAGAIETAPSPPGTSGPADMNVVRLTVELLRPVPVKPLEVTTEVIRPGRKVAVVEATLTHGGVVVARARGLRIRRAEVPVPAQDPCPPSPPLPEEAPTPDLRRAQGAAAMGFIGAVDLRFIHGAGDEPGPATLWGRLVVPVMAGEEPSPLQRTAALADFGNGISRIVDFDTHVFINPDLTVAMGRMPVGEWIEFDTVTRLGPEGFGQAESLIFDEHGPVGRSVQSLIIEGRGA